MAPESVLSVAEVVGSGLLAGDAKSGPNEIVTAGPWTKLKSLARTVVNSVRSLLDCLDGGEAFLEELPFDLSTEENGLCATIFLTFLN